MPAAARRSVSISRWKRNSSSMRDSAARPTSDRARAARPLSKLISALQDECHRIGESLPLLYLLTERPAPLWGDLVEPRAAIVLRGLPRALDVATMLESLQCGVERALVHLEAAARDLLNADADPPSVHWRERQRLEDEEIDAAAKGIRLGRMARRHGVGSPLEVEKSIEAIPLEVKRKLWGAGRGARGAGRGARGAGRGSDGVKFTPNAP